MGQLARQGGLAAAVRLFRRRVARLPPVGFRACETASQKALEGRLEGVLLELQVERRAEDRLLALLVFVAVAGARGQRVVERQHERNRQRGAVGRALLPSQLQPDTQAVGGTGDRESVCVAGDLLTVVGRQPVADAFGLPQGALGCHAADKRQQQGDGNPDEHV